MTTDADDGTPPARPGSAATHASPGRSTPKRVDSDKDKVRPGPSHILPTDADMARLRLYFFIAAVIAQVARPI